MADIGFDVKAFNAVQKLMGKLITSTENNKQISKVHFFLQNHGAIA